MSDVNMGHCDKHGYTEFTPDDPKYSSKRDICKECERERHLVLNAQMNPKNNAISKVMHQRMTALLGDDIPQKEHYAAEHEVLRKRLRREIDADGSWKQYVQVEHTEQADSPQDTKPESEPDKEIEATAKGIRKVKRAKVVRVRKKLIIREGLKHIIGGHTETNFIIGTAPRTGQTRKKENAKPRVVYLVQKDPEKEDCYKGGSTARPFLAYILRRYGGALIGDHPNANDLRPILAYQVPLNGRDAEDGVIAALHAVGSPLGTHHEEMRISDKDVAYHTFHDYMEKIEGAFCVWDEWGQDLLAWGEEVA